MPDIPAVVQRHVPRSARSHATDAKPMRGFMRTLPRVGAPLILLVPEADGGLGRLVTSLVQRVLMDPGGRRLFVETRRSTYYVTLDEPIADLPPPMRARVSFDGQEVTVAPDGDNGEADGGNAARDADEID